MEEIDEDEEEDEDEEGVGIVVLVIDNFDVDGNDDFMELLLFVDEDAVDDDDEEDEDDNIVSRVRILGYFSNKRIKVASSMVML